jgi:hypothetical protein
MRFALLAALVACLVVTTVARHLPLDYSASISRPQPPLTYPTLVSRQNSDSDSDDSRGDNEVLAVPADDTVWNTYVGKGRGMDCAMRGTDREAGWQLGGTSESAQKPLSAASQWTGGTTETNKWYWFSTTMADADCHMDDKFGMGRLSQQLLIEQKPKGLQCFYLQHFNANAKDTHGNMMAIEDQTYTIDSVMYKVEVLPNQNYCSTLMTTNRLLALLSK